MTDWRKLLAGALTGAICLFGLATTVDAAGQGRRPSRSQVKRTEWDRKPTDNPKLDRKLNDRSDRGGVGLSRVIVTLKPGANIGAEYLRYAAKRGRKLGIISGEVVELPNFMLRRLANDPRVHSIVHDRRTGGEMNRAAIVSGARAVQELLGYTGAGVGVAVIDSGVTPWHDDLTYGGNDPRVQVVAGQRTVKFVDFVNGLTTPYDDNGHGSHVAGIILGNGTDTLGARAGIAPSANLVSLKVLDDHGGGYISNVIAALEWAVTNKAAYNIRVINLSVGAAVTQSYTTDPLTLAAKQAVDAGIVVVTAAGNLGKNAQGNPQYGGITAPGNAPWVLTVGAYSHEGTLTRTDDTMAPYSSRGPTARDFQAKPDVVATGTGIVSLAVQSSLFYQTKAPYLLSGTVDTGTFKPYLSLTGTSMAAPIVAGTAALMIEANPNLTPNMVKAIIEYTAQQYNHNALTQGAGFLNTKGAVDLAKFLTAPQVGQIYPHDANWSGTILWGNRKLTGGVIKLAGNAWALSTEWGALADREGDNIVWGTECGGEDCDNIVWGTAFLDDANIVWGTANQNCYADQECDNIVWGTECGGEDCDNIVWGTECGGEDCDNIVWGTECGGEDCDNIVWGTECGGEDCDNIVWGTADDDCQIDQECDNIVWGTECGGEDCDNIVWGTSGAVDPTVWGSAAEADSLTWGCAGAVSPIFDDPAVPSVFDGTIFESLFGNEPVDPPLQTEPTHPDRRHRPAEVGLLMDKMPFREAQLMTNLQSVIAASRPADPATASTDWRHGLPVLTGLMVTLRELQLSDATALLTMLSTEEVARFISPPPTTVEGFERFIAWTHRERAAGNYACFAVVPHGVDTAIGIFQVRQLEPGFGTAEWGFALGSAFWGSGVFMDGARMVIDFAFNTIQTHRLEARAAILNGRGNGALRKIGAMQEGILRKSFLRNGEYLDQALWTILDEDWKAQRVIWGVRVH